MEHLGYLLPESRRPAQAGPVMAEPTHPGALHSRLIKRAPPDEGVSAGSAMEVRGAPQHLS